MRTYREVYNNLVANAQTRGFTSHLGEGSVLRALLESIAFEVTRLERKLSEAERNAFINTATSEALDSHAKDFGIVRFPQDYARSFYYSKNVEFFTFNSASFSTFGITTPQNLIGTELYTQNKDIVYTVTGVDPNVTIGTSNKLFVTVRAVNIGADSNIGERALISHNLANLGSSIGVRNYYSISNGREVESNESLLYRISNQLLSLESCNSKSLELEILRFSHIGKIKILNGGRGSGTTDVVIQPKKGYSLDQNTLSLISSNIQRYTPAGSEVRVKIPDLTYVSIILTLSTNRILTATQKEILRRTIQSSLISYFNSFGIGDSLVKSAILEEVAKNSEVKDILNSKISMRIEENEYEFTEVLTQGRKIAKNSDLFILDLIEPITINIV